MESAFTYFKNEANVNLTRAVEAIKKDKRPETRQHAKQTIWSAYDLYKRALAVSGIDNLQKSSIWKNKIKIFETLLTIEESTSLQLFYFDRCVRAMDKAIYFGIGCQQGTWMQELVGRGAGLMDTL